MKLERGRVVAYHRLRRVEKKMHGQKGSAQCLMALDIGRQGAELDVSVAVPNGYIALGNRGRRTSLPGQWGSVAITGFAQQGAALTAGWERCIISPLSCVA